MSIHDCSDSSLYNILVKKDIGYLGILINKCSDTSEKKNIQNTVDKCKKNIKQLVANGHYIIWKNIANKNGICIQADLPCILSS